MGETADAQRLPRRFERLLRRSASRCRSAARATTASTAAQLAEQMALPDNEPMRRSNRRAVRDQDLLDFATAVLEYCMNAQRRPQPTQVAGTLPATLKPEGRAFIDGRPIAARRRRALRGHQSDRRQIRRAAVARCVASRRAMPRWQRARATFESGVWRASEPQGAQARAAALRRADARRSRAPGAARDARRRQADRQLA